jgi:hypothetical protein
MAAYKRNIMPTNIPRILIVYFSGLFTIRV